MIVIFCVMVCTLVYFQFSWLVRARNLYYHSIDEKRAHIKHRHPMQEFTPVSRKYVLSLTSSPSRISHGISEIFDSFHMDQVHRILLNLPRKFRDMESYDLGALDRLVSNMPKLEVIWHDRDTGPDLKFIGGLRASHDDETLIIMDDDTLYPNTLIQEYDQAWRSVAEDQVSRTIVAPLLHDVFNVTLHPGFASFSVARRDMPVEEFIQRVQLYKNSHPRCARHDDFTMGAALYDLGYQRVQGPVHDVIQLTYGFGSDALHMESISSVKHVLCGHAIFETRKQSPSRLHWTFKDRFSYQFVKTLWSNEWTV